MSVRHHPLTPALKDEHRSHLLCSGGKSPCSRSVTLVQSCDHETSLQGRKPTQEGSSALHRLQSRLWSWNQSTEGHWQWIAHDLLQGGALLLLGIVAWILKRLIKREWGDCLRWAHSLLLPRELCGIGETRNWSYFTIIDVFYCSRQWEVARSPETGRAQCPEDLWPCPVIGKEKFGKWLIVLHQENFSFWGSGGRQLVSLGTAQWRGG